MDKKKRILIATCTCGQPVHVSVTEVARAMVQNRKYSSEAARKAARARWDRFEKGKANSL